MRKNLFKQISILILICFSYFGVSAQTEKYAAPVKWERYKVSEQEVSVLFPKLPVSIQKSDVCIEQETIKYAAYAEGTVYGLNIIYKSKQNAPNYCSPKRKFDETSFKGGVREVKASLKTEQEIKFNQNNFEIVKIKGEFFTYWLIDGFKNKRWFELWVTTEDEEIQTVKNFVESLKIEKNSAGIEIGSGSDRTLGDASPTLVEEKTAAKSDKDEVIPLRLILIPQAKYTDVARQTQTQGTIRVRVTFLADGGIGAVTPVTSLPYGLTEQAIAAAKKLVFIPQKRNKVNINIMKQVDYSFTLY